MYIKSQSEVDNSLYLTTRNFRKRIETLEKGEEGGDGGCAYGTPKRFLILTTKNNTNF